MLSWAYVVFTEDSHRQRMLFLSLDVCAWRHFVFVPLNHALFSMYLVSFLGAPCCMFSFSRTQVGLGGGFSISSVCYPVHTYYWVMYSFLAPSLTDLLVLHFCPKKPSATFSAHLVCSVYEAQCFACIIVQRLSQVNITVLILHMRTLSLRKLKYFVQGSPFQRSNAQR